MFTADDLMLLVGPAAGKALLRYWLEDEDIPEIGSSILDILGKKGADLASRRRGERQFQAIGDRVAENLFPLFYSAQISDDGREKVAKKVAQTLERGRIEVAEITKRDFNPDSFAEYLINGNPYALISLEEFELRLYRRAMREVAASIIDVSSALPHFTEQTFAEVLRRDTELLQKADAILEEIQRIQQGSASANSGEAAAIFEEQYRREVKRRHDHMQLFGIDVSGPSGRHPLSVAYVSLSVTHKKTRNTAVVHSAVPPITPNLADANQSRAVLQNEEVVVSSVERALKASSRLVIRGEAGSGKTTLLKWVAVNAAGGAFTGELVSWNGKIPFLIALREFAGRSLPAPEDLPRLTVPNCAGTMPIGWVHEHLWSGRAVVLVDGVDEVPETQRPRVKEWLTELADSFQDVHFVVTSRPSAIAEDWLSGISFHTAELQPMDVQDIYEFIDHWHDAVEQRLQAYEEKTEMPELAASMKRIISESKPIRNLATSPLLCAVLCALHRDRKKELPENRIELYEACFHMLLDRRDRERGVLITSDAYPQLSYGEKRLLLEELSYSMMRNKDLAVEVERADQIFQRKLKGMPRIAKGTTGTKLDFSHHAA